MSSYGGYLFETFLTLILVCGVAFGVLYGARRLGFGRPSGPIRLVGQLPLDGRRFIYLVRVGDLVFVVGVGEGGFTKLGEMKSSELPALGAGATDEGSPAFAKFLAGAFARGNAPKSAEKPLEPEERP